MHFFTPGKGRKYRVVSLLVDCWYLALPLFFCGKTHLLFAPEVLKPLVCVCTALILLFFEGQFTVLLCVFSKPVDPQRWWSWNRQ